MIPAAMFHSGSSIDWNSGRFELIAPKVICTLGNFSTKLMRGDPTGITRLHGREEIRTIGPRTLRGNGG